MQRMRVPLYLVCMAMTVATVIALKQPTMHHEQEETDEHLYAMLIPLLKSYMMRQRRDLPGSFPEIMPDNVPANLADNLPVDAVLAEMPMRRQNFQQSLSISQPIEALRESIEQRLQRQRVDRNRKLLDRYGRKKRQTGYKWPKSELKATDSSV